MPRSPSESASQRVWPTAHHTHPGREWRASTSPITLNLSESAASTTTAAAPGIRAWPVTGWPLPPLLPAEPASDFLQPEADPGCGWGGIQLPAAAGFPCAPERCGVAVENATFTDNTAIRQSLALSRRALYVVPLGSWHRWGLEPRFGASTNQADIARTESPVYYTCYRHEAAVAPRSHVPRFTPAGLGRKQGIGLPRLRRTLAMSIL